MDYLFSLCKTRDLVVAVSVAASLILGALVGLAVPVLAMTFKLHLPLWCSLLIVIPISCCVGWNIGGASGRRLIELDKYGR